MSYLFPNSVVISLIQISLILLAIGLQAPSGSRTCPGFVIAVRVCMDTKWCTDLVYHGKRRGQDRMLLVVYLVVTSHNIRQFSRVAVDNVDLLASLVSHTERQTAETQVPPAQKGRGVEC